MAATILKTTDASHEILDRIISSEAETAQRAGEREARKYRAQGHACECVGVVAGQVEMPSETGPEISVPTDSMGMRHNFQQSNGTYTRHVFRPVISPPVPTNDEE